MDISSGYLFLGNGIQKPRGRKWRKDRMIGKVIGNCTIGEKLSKGGTSFIYTCELAGNKEVCKITDGKYCEVLLKEFEMLRSLQHPNILKVFDCISCNKIVAVSMENVPQGDLHDFVIKSWPVLTEKRRKFAGQILSAVEAIHSMDIAHCDLKLENILIDNQGDIKLIDFGSALRVSQATFDSFAYIATTPEYLPPEIICANADSSYDIRAIDEWSVGVVLFILLTGRFPFGEVDQTRIAKYIKKMKTSSSFELRQKEEHLLYVEKEYLDMIRGLLNFNDDNRLSVAQVLDMPYFRSTTKSLKDIEDEIDKDFESVFDDL